MKNFTLSVFILLCALTARAQTQAYYFGGTFNDINGIGGSLSEVLSCGGTNGSFGSGMINTTTGTCGTTPKPIFNFTQGGGLSYPNGFVMGNYTINLFFQFSKINGYNRIIDFQDGTTDIGLYILNGTLNFYPNGDVGVPNFFTTNTYYLLTLVREGATNTITVYVNGAPFAVYSDVSNYYTAPTIGTPIILFRDNIAAGGQCENSAGSIKYFSLDPTISTPVQVLATYTNICSIALPLNLLSFGVQAAGDQNILSWQTAQEQAIDYFTAERSNDGSNWSAIGKVRAAGNTNGGNYTITDAQPMLGTNYYRLHISETTGTQYYSRVVRQEGKGNAAQVRISPNPAVGKLTIINSAASQNGGTATITNIQGTEVYHFNLQASQTVDVHAWPAGIYLLKLPDHSTMKIVKQ